MADEVSPKDPEERAARRLRRVGIAVTVVWLAGLGFYVCGLGSTDNGWRWPSIEPRAWRENVGFLVDWTSLILMSGTFFALLWWPKHVLQTISDLLAKHRDKFEEFLRGLFRRSEAVRTPREQPIRTDAAIVRESDAESETSPSEARSEEAVSAPVVSPPIAPEAPEVAAATPLRRTGHWWWFGFVLAVAALLICLRWCAVDHPPSIEQPMPTPPEARSAEGRASGVRTYTMREGDGLGAVYAITRAIRDPAARARCVQALESDPSNRPPHDRRQRPGHVISLPDECPMP